MILVRTRMLKTSRDFDLSCFDYVFAGFKFVRYYTQEKIEFRNMSNLDREIYINQNDKQVDVDRLHQLVTKLESELNTTHNKNMRMELDKRLGNKYRPFSLCNGNYLYNYESYSLEYQWSISSCPCNCADLWVYALKSYAPSAEKMDIKAIEIGN